MTPWLYLFFIFFFSKKSTNPTCARLSCARERLAGMSTGPPTGGSTGVTVVADGGEVPSADSGKEGGRTSNYEQKWTSGQFVELWKEGDWWKCEVLTVSSTRGVQVKYLGSTEYAPVWVAADSDCLRARTQEWDGPNGVRDGDGSPVGSAQRSSGGKARQSDASCPSVVGTVLQVCILP